MQIGHISPGLCPVHCLFLFATFELPSFIEMRTSSECQGHLSLGRPSFSNQPGKWDVAHWVIVTLEGSLGKA